MQAIRASRCREPFTFLEIVNILSLHNPEAPYNNKTIPLYRLPTSLTLKPIPNSRQFALLVRVCDVPFNLVGFFLFQPWSRQWDICSAHSVLLSLCVYYYYTYLYCEHSYALRRKHIHFRSFALCFPFSEVFCLGATQRAAECVCVFMLCQSRSNGSIYRRTQVLFGTLLGERTDNFIEFIHYGETHHPAGTSVGR